MPLAIALARLAAGGRPDRHRASSGFAFRPLRRSERFQHLGADQARWRPATILEAVRPARSGGPDVHRFPPRHVSRTSRSASLGRDGVGAAAHHHCDSPLGPDGPALTAVLRAHAALGRADPARWPSSRRAPARILGVDVDRVIAWVVLPLFRAGWGRRASSSASPFNSVSPDMGPQRGAEGGLAVDHPGRMGSIAGPR